MGQDMLQGMGMKGERGERAQEHKGCKATGQGYERLKGSKGTRA